MKRPWYFLASLALLLTFALNACGTSPAAPSAPKSSQEQGTNQTSASAPTGAPAGAPKTESKPAAPSGTLRVAIPDFSYESMDPIYFESQWGWTMYDRLLTFDKNGNVVGNVAQSYDLSPDGLTWTFKLRKDIKFWNGDPLTSADVAFSITHFASKESTNPWSPYLLNNFDSMSTPDDYTFVYKAKTPEPMLKIPFAWARILPKNYFEKVGQDEFRKNPMGSGPYEFVKWVSKTSMEFKVNPNYWGDVKPAWNSIIELMVPEEATRIDMLKRGDADIITALSFDRLVQLKNEGYRLQEIGLPTLGNLEYPGTWVTKGPTSDIRVRQAMAYAINRDELSKTFFKGLAKPGGLWFMSEQTWGWKPEWEKTLIPGYDPDKAKQLLKEAGYPDKFSPQDITLYTTSAGYTPDLMQVLQGYWAAVGIKVNIKVMDSAALGGIQFKRATTPDDPQIGAIWPWVFGSFFNDVYHSANMFTSKGVHGTGNDPTADEMYAKATKELDPDKAKKDWQDFIEYAYTKMWVTIPLVEVPTYGVVGPKVGDFSQNSWLSLEDSYVGIQHK